MSTIPNPTKSRTWDLGTSANGTFFDTEFNQLYANDNDLDSRVEALEAVGQYAKLSDTKAANTGGGAFTSGAWRTRELQEEIDASGIVAVSSNQFTLQAGTYRIAASAPAFRSDSHKTRLRNITDSTTTLPGTSEIVEQAGFNVQTRSHVVGQFTIAGAKTFELQHYCTNTHSSNGFGSPANVGEDEVYAIVELWKIA